MGLGRKNKHMTDAEKAGLPEAPEPSSTWEPAADPSSSSSPSAQPTSSAAPQTPAAPKPQPAWGAPSAPHATPAEPAAPTDKGVQPTSPGPAPVGPTPASTAPASPEPASKAPATPEPASTAPASPEPASKAPVAPVAFPASEAPATTAEQGDKRAAEPPTPTAEQKARAPQAPPPMPPPAPVGSEAIPPVPPAFDAGIPEPSAEASQTAPPEVAAEDEVLPVLRDNHPEKADEADNDHLLPVPLEHPQLAPHLQDLKVSAQDALIERMGSRLYDRTLTEEQIESYVVNELGGWLFEQNARISDSEREQLTAELLNDVLRHGPIEPFLDDDSVSEIMVNGLALIYVERNGKLARTNSHFLTEAHLRQVIERIVSKIGRRIDESSPMVDARLADGSRVNAVIPPLAVDGPSLTIRKFAKEALQVDDLIGFGTLSPRSVHFLEACVRGRMNVLVSGGTGTGKTTLLNVLSNFIPEDERIVTLEDAVELQLRQEHLVRLESRPPNVEGKGQITIRDLVRNSLRMRPDRVIIGECRGGEALDMLQAMNTGHDGSLSTLHANGPRDALARLETLCLMAGMDLPVRAIREQIVSAINLLVHVARLRDGTRRVTHISEVVGMENDAVVLTDIYTFDFDAGLDIDGRYSGLLEPTGRTPALVSKLREHGEDIDMSLFELESSEAEEDEPQVIGGKT